MKNPTKVIISNMALAILISNTPPDIVKLELDDLKLFSNEEPPKLIVWGNSSIILTDSHPIAIDIIIKITKEPTLPSFLPLKATLPITMQK